MALEHPRLLAASLIAALSLGSCSTPPQDSSPAGNQPSSGNTAAMPPTAAGGDARATGAAQEPQGLSQERVQALVAKYLENARGLRANGMLPAAKSELLKAIQLAPNNQEVATLLASVQAELGEPAGTINTYGDEQMRLRQIGEQRARANVETQLQKAAAMSGDKNYAGALEELRIAKLTIEVKDQVDWMDLPQRVQAATDETQRLYDEQVRAGQEAESARLAERLRARGQGVADHHPAGQVRVGGSAAQGEEEEKGQRALRAPSL